MWGANAVNGIVNIITKPAKDTQGGLLVGGGGTQEQGFGTFRYGGTAGSNVSYRVYGNQCITRTFTAVIFVNPSEERETP